MGLASFRFSEHESALEAQEFHEKFHTVNHRSAPVALIGGLDFFQETNIANATYLLINKCFNIGQLLKG